MAYLRYMIAHCFSGMQISNTKWVDACTCTLHHQTNMWFSLDITYIHAHIHGNVKRKTRRLLKTTVQWLLSTCRHITSICNEKKLLLFHNIVPLRLQKNYSVVSCMSTMIKKLSKYVSKILSMHNSFINVIFHLPVATQQIMKRFCSVLVMLIFQTLLPNCIFSAKPPFESWRIETILSI